MANAKKGEQGAKPQAQFTPGPWYRNIPPANKYPTIWSGRNKHVAYIKQLQDDSEAEANINLIAAAPAMYEALSELVKYLREEVADEALDTWAPVFKAAMALAQAEGKA